jgi:hypothetical protein
MVNNLKLCKIFWSIPAAAAFLAALAGVVSKDLYIGLFPAEFLPGAVPQDVLTLAVCIFLFALIASTRKDDTRKPIMIVGLLGSLFYLYGIFTMERVYNWFYLLYATIFASSFWSIVYTLSQFRSEVFAGFRFNTEMVRVTAIFSIGIAVLFTALWMGALIPLMRERNRIEFLYSIYILDLCFIMPAFFMTGVMSLRRRAFGILMAPALMILGFFVIFPLGVNELAKPSAGMPIAYGPMVVSFLFAALMLIVAILHLRMIPASAPAGGSG